MTFIDYLGRTLLHYAAKNNSVLTSHFLIKEAKVDINAEDIYGNTPLAIACLENNYGILFYHIF